MGPVRRSARDSNEGTAQWQTPINQSHNCPRPDIALLSFVHQTKAHPKLLASRKNVQESDASSVFSQSPTSRFCLDDHFGAHRKVSCIMYLYINQQKVGSAVVWHLSHREKRINILNLKCCWAKRHSPADGDVHVFLPARKHSSKRR